MLSRFYPFPENLQKFFPECIRILVLHKITKTSTPFIIFLMVLKNV